jgi:F-type H+-transporting ATPase subunit a
MPEQIWFTALLNRFFAGPVDRLLHALGVQPTYPQAPITNFVAMQLLVVAFLVIFFVLVRSRLSADNPGGLQHLVEGLESFIKDQSQQIIGPHSEGYTAFLVALGFFILICNLIGMIPGFDSPTAVPSVPLGCALVAFFYYHIEGIRKSGIAYLKHFAGPFWWLAVLMVPIEIISHLARVLSLTVRLFANMFAGDMVTLVFFSLIPIGVPIAFLGLHIGVSLLQTYIFVLLTTVYLQGAVGEQH